MTKAKGKAIEVSIDDGFNGEDFGMVEHDVNPDAPNRSSHEWASNVTWPCIRCGADPVALVYEECPGGTYLDPVTGVRL